MNIINEPYSMHIIICISFIPYTLFYTFSFILHHILCILNYEYHTSGLVGNRMYDHYLKVNEQLCVLVP